MLLGLAACSSMPAARAAPTEVVFVGDSLAVEAAPYLDRMIEGKRLVPDYFGGTAPCDWTGKDLHVTAHSVVVISFTGNSLTPCMAGADGTMLHGTALVGRYRTAVTALVQEARRAGARVILVGQPTPAATAPNAAVVGPLDDMYAAVAKAEHASVVDAGAAVERAGGAYAERLPCLPGEKGCDAAGTVDVRSSDGVHFCPVAAEPGKCPVYSAGAYRFAAAIAAAVNDM